MNKVRSNQQSTEKSVRLFKNDFLESLTHVHPIVPLLFWSPVIAFLLWRAIFVQQLPLLSVALTAVLALLTWTLIEYLVHRFTFHFPAKSRLAKWLVYLFHGIHHDAPADKSRLVMPPVGAVIIFSVLWVFARLIVPPPWLEPFCAFFLCGYLVYDYLHYATHHFSMRNRVLRTIKKNHMQHHFYDPGLNFGVSSPLWDWVFGTHK